jgi:hypothetical protein
MIEGFCISEKTDVTIDAHGRCLTDGSLAIPPSWGNSQQTWTGTGWLPEIARPANYQYKPKQYAVAQVIAEPVSAECQHCDLTFSYQPKGGDAPRYCRPKCKDAAARARRKAVRSAA